MTLKELLDKVEFDALCPYLEKYEPKHLDNIYAFREAYDILRTLTPSKQASGEIRIEWEQDNGGTEEKWISVCPMHDANWEDVLARELIIAPDVKLPMEELAMHCLWEITYWGFSPDEKDETIAGMVRHTCPITKYEIALDKLDESIWRHQVPRKCRSLSPSGKRCRIIAEKHPLVVNVRHNRSKRKRAYRQERRQEFLEKMIQREKTIAELTVNGSSFEKKDVTFLFDIQYGTRYEYRSVTSNVEGRLDYILTSIIKYQQIELKKYNNAIFYLSVPSRYPLADLELENFRIKIRELLGYDNMLFGMAITDSSNMRIKAVLHLILD